MLASFDFLRRRNRSKNAGSVRTPQLRHWGRALARALLLAYLYLWPTPGAAMPGDHVWSRGWDASGHAATDDLGAVGTAGTFFGSVDLGGGPHVAGNFIGGDVFLARYGPAGAYAWSRSFTPTADGVIVNAVAVDSIGSLYVGGECVTGSIDFGGGPIGGMGQIWIAKFDPSGNHLWSATYGGFADLVDLTASAAGVAVTGNFSFTLDFGGGALTSAGGLDAFVAVLDPTGAHLWSASFGDASPQFGKSLVLSDMGGVGLCGAMQGTVDFGGGPIAAAATDLFLARFNANGVHQWSQGIPGGFGTGTFIELDLALSEAGNLGLSGTLLAATNFGDGVVVASGISDAFRVLYDGDGNLLGSKLVGGPGQDSAQAIQFDAGDNVLLAGTFTNVIDFGNGPVISAGFTDLFVASWAQDGTALWSRRFGTPMGDDRCEAVADPNGNIVLFGAAINGINFGGGGLADAQFFLAKLRALDTTVDAPLGTASPAGTCYPNPFRDSVRFRFAATGDEVQSRARVVTIHDVRGRTLRRLSGQGGELIWDGLDGGGEPVPAGVYFYRSAQGPAEATGRIVRLR